jgi:hypothetical protein
LDEEKEVVEDKIDSLRARLILRVSPNQIPVIKTMQQHKRFGCVTVTKDTSKRSPKFATAQEAIEFILHSPPRKRPHKQVRKAPSKARNRKTCKNPAKD